MKDAILGPPLNPEDTASARHASYILRCWTGDVGQIRARLIDVHSGVAWPVANLLELPGLVERLMHQAAPGREGR